jgi:acyl-CoA thioester hydrolase
LGQPFIHTMRVRYAECDAQGVVFNAHYLAYVDVGITELWRAAFGSYGAMLDRGLDVVVAEAQLRFRAAAHFDDELTLEVTVTHMGNTSIVTRHRILRREELVVECTIRHVMVDRTTLTKTEIPGWAREQLSRWVTESPKNRTGREFAEPDAAGGT